jgi:hypothetical protein
LFLICFLYFLLRLSSFLPIFHSFLLSFYLSNSILSSSFPLSLYLTKLLSCCSCRWGETLSLNYGHERTYCSSLRR